MPSRLVHHASRRIATEHPKPPRRARTAATIAIAVAISGVSAAAVVAAPDAMATATAPVCNGTWQQRAGVLPTNVFARDITAFSAKDAWIAGDDGKVATITHWNGATSTTTKLPKLQFATYLTGTSATDLTVVGPDLNWADAAYHFDGKTWTPMPGLAAVMGEYGSSNSIVARGKNDVWAFGVRFNATGAIPIVAHWNGSTWKAMPNNLADSSFAVPLATSKSPNGEIWVLGEDVRATSDHPIWRTPFAGRIVGDKVVRTPIPAVPTQVSTMPLAMTWTPQGQPVITGWTGEDFLAGIYPYSATRQVGGQWRLAAIPAPVAQNTSANLNATVGKTVYSASVASIADSSWVSLSRQSTNGWSNPINLNAHARESAGAMAGLPDGTGFLATIVPNPTAPGTIARMWMTCGAPAPTTGADTTKAAGALVSATATTPPGTRAATVPSLTERVAIAHQAKKRNAAIGSDGLSLTPRSETPASAIPTSALSGPVVDRLRAAQRTATGTTYVATPACGPAKPGQSRCLASVVSTRSSTGKIAAAVTPLPIGYGPVDYRAAYKLPATGGNGKTVGIVGVYNYPALATDLAAYRMAAGLPPCTIASGCLRVVGQTGGSRPTQVDDGWSLEAALDLQTVSAACPDCKILMVQANDPSDDNLAAANQTAARLGSWVVNNSFGRDELLGDPSYAKSFVPAGVPLVAATGDWGHGAIFPSTVPSVIGVSGTTLLESPGTPRGWRESVWDHSGGGCSAVQARPVWQRNTQCANDKSSAASLSANGDPSTGSGVYFTPAGPGDAGWHVVGGTSLSAPLVAAMSAVTNHRLSTSSIWSGGLGVHDISTGGSTGWCAPLWECTALPGYDAATGFGSPRW